LPADPVAIGIGAGSEQRASIAVTIIGGQTLCLLLTLLVVPVAYSYWRNSRRCHGLLWPGDSLPDLAIRRAILVRLIAWTGIFCFSLQDQNPQHGDDSALLG